MTSRGVIVCDHEGNPLRIASVAEVHEGAGVLHKAFSVFVFRNQGGEVLLQQRSRHKRLFPLRWANTCCSHPRPGESLLAAARRRLRQEFGFSVALREVGAFVYRAEDPDSHLTEYEFDAVLIGSARGALAVKPDPAEIAEWRWVPVADLERDLRDHVGQVCPVARCGSGRCAERDGLASHRVITSSQSAMPPARSFR